MWGRVTKTVKTAFMTAFTNYLKNYDEVQFKEIEFLDSFPTDKEDARSSWVQIIDKFPNIENHLPMIAISSVSGDLKKNTFGPSMQTWNTTDAEGNPKGSWLIGILGDLNVSIDIGCAGPNERSDLTDALSNFLLIYAMKYQNQLFPDSNHTEHWKITLPDSVSLGGESEIPRGDDGKDRVYISNLSVQIKYEDFIERELEPLLLGTVSGSAYPINYKVSLTEGTKTKFRVGETYQFKVEKGSSLIWELPPTPRGEEDMAILDQEGNFTALMPGKIQMSITDPLNYWRSVFNLVILP